MERLRQCRRSGISAGLRSLIARLRLSLKSRKRFQPIKGLLINLRGLHLQMGAMAGFDYVSGSFANVLDGAPSNTITINTPVSAQSGDIF